ncbi:MAG: hypothetical protein ACSLEN_03605 [Candidatus Malihini olakiniferum]
MQANHIQLKLLEHGLPNTTPFALIENGTTTEQKVLTGQLVALGSLAQHVASHSLMIIGEAVGLREKLK